jgi:hypothetical protein
MKNKFKLGDIIFCPLYDQGDLLVVSIERDGYKVVGINDAVDGEKHTISKDWQELYDVIDNIFKKNK